LIFLKYKNRKAVKRSDFTKKVFEALAQTGMTIGALAEKAGYSRKHTSLVIHGHVNSPAAKQRIMDSLEGNSSPFITKPDRAIVYTAGQL
jgi:hypothetical protein